MATIEFPETARMVFKMPGRAHLIVNPRECKGDDRKLVWPHCSTRNSHACKEMINGPDASVPVSRVIDNQYGGTDYASPWFAFWEADCMAPPIYIVRAESWEAAYEDFCDVIAPISDSDLPDYLNAAGEFEGNYNSNGQPIDTESVNGCEISLIEVTCE